MYVARPPLGAPSWSRDLNQGDVIAGLLLPKPLTDKTFCRREGPKTSDSATAQDLALPNPHLRVLLRLDREPFCLVLSNSCDNAGGDLPLLICPVRPLKFKEDSTDAEKWRQISVAATGTASPKHFYLPENIASGLPRSSAQLPIFHSLTHEYVTRCAQEGGAKRVVGLAEEGVRHLQRGLDVFFARNPREDHDWPSNDDLLLKAAWLEEQITRGGPRREDYREELRVLRERLAPPAG